MPRDMITGLPVPTLWFVQSRCKSTLQYLQLNSNNHSNIEPNHAICLTCNAQKKRKEREKQKSTDWRFVAGLYSYFQKVPEGDEKENKTTDDVHDCKPGSAEEPSKGKKD